MTPIYLYFFTAVARMAPLRNSTPVAVSQIDGAETVTCTPPSGSTFPVGTTTVTCTASDSGNTTHVSFHVNVVSHAPPKITVPTPGPVVDAQGPKGAVVTYGLFVLGTSAAWNVFMLALRPERGLLKPGVPPELIASTRRHVALGFVIYLVATGLAFVNPYLGLGVITAMWGFWSVIAYRALNRHGRWSADASGGGSDVGSEE